MQPPFNAQDVFTMKKFMNSYVNQQRFFRKKTENKSESNEITFKDPKLPPIAAKVAVQIDNINYKYKSKPMVEKRRLNQRKVSLPVLKYSPQENALQLQLIKRLLDNSPTRVQNISNDDFLNNILQLNMSSDSDLLSSSFDFQTPESIEHSVDNFLMKQNTQLAPKDEVIKNQFNLNGLDPYIKCQYNKMYSTMPMKEKEKLFYEIIVNWNQCYLENYRLQEQLQNTSLMSILDQSKIFQEPQQFIKYSQISISTQTIEDVTSFDQQLIECLQSNTYTDIKNKTFTVDAQLMQFTQMLLIYFKQNYDLQIPTPLQDEFQILLQRLRKSKGVSANLLTILELLI